MGQRTPLYDTHVASGAKLVDFGGWDMPVAYGSQIEEHHAVRRDAGMFDVSHMCPVDVLGVDARRFLRKLVANNVDKLTQSGKALYSCMLNDAGGVIDDLIIYFLRDDAFRVVVNASTAEKDLAWMEKVRLDEGFAVTIAPRRDLAMIAVQGPNARAKFWQVRPATRSATEALGPFFAAEVGELFVARTGYTGEDGFEVMLPAAQAPRLWADLKAAGVAEAGLGARDTLRLEAGMNLYGNDMDETVSPLDAGLAWTRRPEIAARFRRPRCARAAVGKCGRAQSAGRAEAALQWRAALTSEGADCRGRRRGHERHVRADAGLFGRDGARAARGEGRRYRAGRYPRQALAGAGSEDAVRAQRQGNDLASQATRRGVNSMNCSARLGRPDAGTTDKEKP